MNSNLRVATIVRNFSPAGGLELYTHKVVEGLLERGAKVTVFCQASESDLVHPRLTLKTIEARPMSAGKAQRLVHDFNAGNRALESCKGEFDIVHSQHYPTSHANVATFHNHAVLRWSKVGWHWEKLINNTKFKLFQAYKLRDLQDRILCRNARVLVFPSAIMQEDYYEAYPFLLEEDTPFVIAYPGASLLEDDGAESPAHPTLAVGQHQPFTFLFVGRGYRRKGLDILFSACSKLVQDKRNDFRLLIAGLEEKPFDRLRLNLMGISHCVEYLGFRRDMENVYGLAHAAVLPSRVEPFGMAPLQAAQRGLVPIVSRVSGASEVLHHGKDSLILENHLDADELARLMARLINDETLVSRLGARAIRTALSVNWHQTVDSTLRAYELALTSSTGRIQAALK